MIKQINRIVKLGIKEDMPFAVQKRIKIANTTSLIVFVIAFVFLYPALTLDTSTNIYESLLNKVILVSNFAFPFFSLYSNHKGFTNLGRSLIMFLGLLVATFFPIMYGKTTGSEYYFISVLVGSLLMLDSKVSSYTMFSICFISMLGVVHHINNYPPIVEREPRIFMLYMNIIFTILIVFGLLSVFKNEHVNYERTIELKNQELKTYQEELHSSNEMLNEKNKQMTDSIMYAKRIQTAMLPSRDDFGRVLPQSFVFFSPKDIVSGDFYWCASLDDKMFIAVADCTGHGVPGAFMSMLGGSIMHQIVSEMKIFAPSQILKFLDTRIRTYLTVNENSVMKDGMEMSLVAIDLKAKKIHFASSNRSFVLIRNNELTEYKGDKIYIGSDVNKDPQFTEQIIETLPDDTCYMYSDGFTDQFDAANEKKLGSKKLKQFLVTLQEFPFETHESKVREMFNTFKGSTEQVDDVTLLGFKLY